ncbi:MAG: hypothetical protein PHU63_03880 [Candidatus ainarchaeum sp.]|nr:hypothetical protein [Candidatus ainarchaeum sp.]
MKPNYPQPYSIKVPEWMTEEQKNYYRLKEHHKQKREAIERVKDSIYLESIKE